LTRGELVDGRENQRQKAEKIRSVIAGSCVTYRDLSKGSKKRIRERHLKEREEETSAIRGERQKALRKGTPESPRPGQQLRKIEKQKNAKPGGGVNDASERRGAPRRKNQTEERLPDTNKNPILSTISIEGGLPVSRLGSEGGELPRAGHWRTRFARTGAEVPTKRFPSMNSN